jgi:hypothetical protein
LGELDVALKRTQCNSSLRMDGHPFKQQTSDILGFHGGEYEDYSLMGYSAAKINRRFRGAYCHHHQGDESSSVCFNETTRRCISQGCSVQDSRRLNERLVRCARSIRHERTPVSRKENVVRWDYCYRCLWFGDGSISKAGACVPQSV